MAKQNNNKEIVPCDQIKTKEWKAINNKMPLGEGFYVTGKYLSNNSGIKAKLSKKEPQGINQNILLLNLEIIQVPGIHPRPIDWISVRYDESGLTEYTSVNVFCDDSVVADIKVKEVN